MAPIIYEPLPSQDSIRVLEIQNVAEDANETINCTMYTQKLTDWRICLSYEWGPTLPQYPILVNGISFQITQNLHRFLRRARAESLLKPLWIDAICINQDDPAEKIAQIRMMAKIYNGVSVMVWLGHTLDETVTNMHRLSIHQSWGSDYPNVQEYYSWLYKPIRHKSESQDDITVAQMISAIEKLHNFFPMQALWHSITSSTYWDRAWTVQEFMLGDAAKKKLFTMGAAGMVDLGITLQTIRLTAFMEGQLAEAMPDLTHTGPTRIMEICPHPARGRRVLELLMGQAYFPELRLVLRSTTYLKCSIPRDRIFSIAAVVKHGEHMPINYEWPTEELIWKLIQFFWRFYIQSPDEDGRRGTLIDLACVICDIGRALEIDTETTLADHLPRVCDLDREHQIELLHQEHSVLWTQLPHEQTESTHRLSCSIRLRFRDSIAIFECQILPELHENHNYLLFETDPPLPAFYFWIHWEEKWMDVTHHTPQRGIFPPDISVD